MTFDSLNYDGSATAESDGFKLAVSVEHDSDHGAPWDEEDGHGEVTAWERRDKAPGELILCDDRGSKRFYDFAGACKKALAEGWGVAGGQLPGETARALAARAARADFDHLESWCNDRWRYVGVIVTASKDGIDLGTASLWGIAEGYEGDDGSYLLSTANDLAPDAVTEARAMLARLCACDEVA